MGIIVLVLVVFGLFIIGCCVSGTAPNVIKSYHIYKYKKKYFVKIKIFAYLTLRYVDKSQPLKYKNWRMSNIEYCLMNSKEEAEELIETLKAVITEIE